MDVRVLKYFLTVARTGNITKAAEILHITQPTLSRQIMELETELNTELLARGKRQLTLTTAGTLFQQRAQEIIALLEKTQRDIIEYGDEISGIVSIGCVETSASLLLPDALEDFNAQYPMVQYEIFSANGDGIKEKIDSGTLDMGILLEPVETAKYESFPLPYQERWGVLMRADDLLARKDSLTVDEIASLPLLMTQRRIVSDEIESWFGDTAKNLHVIEYHDFITNSMLLIERGLGYAICVEGAYSIRPNPALHFVPLSPERISGHVLAWKKNRIFGQAASLFLEYLQNIFMKCYV